jgi:hypothetical protein
MIALRSFFSEGKSLDDWLSPILVKELRQGLRARVFLVSFLLLQVFLSVLVLANLAAQDDRSTLETQSAFFWGVLGFALLVLMPLRGLVTISVEVKNRCMETITLTRLTAWRVVFGKWSALFAQSLLLVTATLPYAVLRYFIGGDDVVQDLFWLAVLLWFSGIFIAISIAISGMTNVVIRIILLIVFVIGCVTISMSTSSYTLHSYGFAAVSGWAVFGWLVIFGFFIPALLFELTASSLAPASENHAFRRRLLTVAFFLAALALFSQFKNGFEAGIMLPFLILIAMCYFELAEKARVIPRMVQAFVRKKSFGRIGVLFLLPGWPSALLFSLLIIPLAALGVYSLLPATSGSDEVIGGVYFILSVFGSVLVPIFICHLFLPRLEQVLLVVVLYNIIMLGAIAILQGFAAMTNTSIAPLVAFLPSVPSMMIASSGSYSTFKDSTPFYILANLVVLLMIVTILFVSSRRYFTEIAAQFPQRKLAPVALPPVPGDKL